MILNAIKSGVSEEKIAKVLNVDIAKIREKRDLLQGICKEAAEILKNRKISPSAFSYIRKMKPLRQIEVAELLTASNNFGIPYVKALLAATPPRMLIKSNKSKIVRGLTPEEIAKMEKEMETLQSDLKAIEASYGNEVLNLVLARAYIGKLLGNARISRYLSLHHADILAELQKVSEGSSLTSMVSSGKQVHE